MQLFGKRIATVNKEAEAIKGFGAVPNDPTNTGVVQYKSEEVTEVEVGDEVHFGNQLITVKSKGISYKIMDFENVLAKVSG